MMQIYIMNGDSNNNDHNYLTSYPIYVMFNVLFQNWYLTYKLAYVYLNFVF